MYKRLIDKVVDEKIEQNRDMRKQQSARDKLKNTRYCIGDVYVGRVAQAFVVKQGGKEVVKQMIKDRDLLLVQVEMDHFKDIEQIDKYYPFVRLNEQPVTNTYYVPERLMESFVDVCAETIAAEGINLNARFTIHELREVLKRQERLNEINF